MTHRHPIIAAVYDRVCAGDERAFLSALRHDLLGEAHGVVVELGAGTGLNFPHYRAGEVDIVHALEPDPYMRSRAAPRAAQSPLPIELREATAEAMPFAPATADTLVGTLILCSVDDTQQVLNEILRVLKPGGSFLFIEHVRSERPSSAWLEDLINPVWRRVAGNCHCNRATVKLLLAAGFTVEETHRFPKRGPWGNAVVAGRARAGVSAPG